MSDIQIGNTVACHYWMDIHKAHSIMRLNQIDKDGMRPTDMPGMPGPGTADPQPLYDRYAVIHEMVPAATIIDERV